MWAVGRRLLRPHPFEPPDDPTGPSFLHICLAAALPLLPAKQRALAEDDWLETEALVCCPDPGERLVMRIERLDLVHLDAQELT